MPNFVLTYPTLELARERARQEMKRRRRLLGTLGITKYAYPVLRKVGEVLFGIRIHVERDLETNDLRKPTGITPTEFNRLQNVPFIKAEWRRVRR